MHDLRSDLRDVYRKLASTEGPEGGRIILVMSALPGEGVSSVAASLALIAAETARKPAWLIDLDLRRNHVFNAFAIDSFAAQFGGVGPPYSAALKTQPFFSIDPEPEAEIASGIFTAHRVGETRLMVTHFDTSRLKAGHSIGIRPRPDYWAAVRRATDWTFIDAPALDRANAGLAIAAQADAVLLVVQADRTTPAQADTLRTEIERHGGTVAGVVFNRIRGDAVLADRWAR